MRLADWAEAYHLRHDTNALLRLEVLTEIEGRIRTHKMRRDPCLTTVPQKILKAYLYCEKLWREMFNADVEITIDKRYIQRTQAIQEWLQQRFDDKGIIAEVCPTSNVVIAKLGGYANHPAFQFDNPRNGVDKVRFTVNADDPLTFNTTVEDELAHLYYAIDRFPGALQRPEVWVRKRCETSTQTTFVVPHTLSLAEHQTAIGEAIRLLEESR